jgi:hypothetical protein
MNLQAWSTGIRPAHQGWHRLRHALRSLLWESDPRRFAYSISMKRPATLTAFTRDPDVVCRSFRYGKATAARHVYARDDRSVCGC